MGLFDFLNRKAAPAKQAVQMSIERGIVTWDGQNQSQIVRDSYVGNDLVYAIITLITQKAKVAPWFVYKVKSKEAQKRYLAKMQQPDKIANYNELKELKEQAFEIYEGDAKLNELLKYPNGDDTWSDIIEQWVGFKKITGNAFMYAKQAGEVSINRGKPLELYMLPSQYMAIKVNTEIFPPKKVAYQLYYGQYIPFTTEEILHDKYFNPEWTATGGQLYGLSPLRAASKVLTRSNASKEASVAMFDNMGPLGVLYMDDDRFDPLSGSAQAQALKMQISANTGASKHGSAAVSGYKVGWAQIGLPAKDLQLIESEKWDKEALCSIYGVPPVLLGNMDAATYNNMKEAEKALTIRAVLPELTAIRDNLNRKMQTDWGYKGSDIFVDFDMTIYSELEANRAEQSTWLNTAWWITPEQKLKIQGLSPDPNVPIEDYQKLYVPSGLTPIDEFTNLPVDVPPAL
jgi:HK97 family phage portal protein